MGGAQDELGLFCIEELVHRLEVTIAVHLLFSLVFLKVGLWFEFLTLDQPDLLIPNFNTLPRERPL